MLAERRSDRSAKFCLRITGTTAIGEGKMGEGIRVRKKLCGDVRGGCASCESSGGGGGVSAWRVACVAFCARKCEPHGLCKQRCALKFLNSSNGLLLRFHDDERLTSGSHLHGGMVTEVER
jgi:hypothetical protein